MKSGLTETMPSDDAPVAAKSTPTLSTITLRFVTLLSGIVVLFTWAWSR